MQYEKQTKQWKLPFKMNNTESNFHVTKWPTYPGVFSRTW